VYFKNIKKSQTITGTLLAHNKIKKYNTYLSAHIQNKYMEHQKEQNNKNKKI